MATAAALRALSLSRFPPPSPSPDDASCRQWFVKELQEALDANIQDCIMKEHEMHSYIEERRHPFIQIVF
jgi:acetylornithine deacetylase/succinyl-diaminopimelate desuccinylase-like protein